jgi:hypothetical protein
MTASDHFQKNRMHVNRCEVMYSSITENMLPK